MPELTIFKSITPEALERKVDKYFENVKKLKTTPSLTGLALALHCTRKNIVDYKHTDEYGPILQRAKLRCENALEDKIIAGTPPTGLIFLMKNNYDYKDKIESDVNFTGTISLSKLFGQAEEQKRLQGTREDVIEGEVEEIPLDDNLFEDKKIINEETQEEELPADIFS